MARARDGAGQQAMDVHTVYQYKQRTYIVRVAHGFVEVQLQRHAVSQVIRRAAIDQVAIHLEAELRRGDMVLSLKADGRPKQQCQKRGADDHEHVGYVASYISSY